MSPRKQFPLRIDAELWAEIERMAAADLRSVNGQVEYLLREAVLRRRGGAPRHTGGADTEPPSAVDG